MVYSLFLPTRAERLHVYLLPVPLSAGINKLRGLVLESFPRVDAAAAYLFVNKKRHGVTVFWGDENGSQTTQQRFAEGAIVLPEVHADGLPWATLDPATVLTLFRP